jgi:hypothetical protein
VKFRFPIRRRFSIRRKASKKPTEDMEELYRNFTKVEVTHDSSDQLNYMVSEPTLTSSEDKLLYEIEDLLVNELDVAVAEFELRENSERYILKQIDRIAR